MSVKRIWLGGAGYAGLPLALALDDAGHDIVAYDVDTAKIERLRAGESPYAEISERAIQNADISYDTTPDQLSGADVLIGCVPTPLTEADEPDLTMVEALGRTIGRHLTVDTTVVLESTIYPGGTNDVFAPAIAETTALSPGSEYRLGYSPERVVPGDPLDALTATTKVISAQDVDTLDVLESVYGPAFDRIHRAPTIETAEAAKCLENTQRDVNIALINEFTMAAAADDLDYERVLDAAETKWNFHRYEPGLVGGHCIPVDPYYLIHRFDLSARSTSLIESARRINDQVPGRIVDLILEALDDRQEALGDHADGTAERGRVVTDGAGVPDSQVLVAGLTYKPDASDLRSEAVRAIVSQLRELDLAVAGYDPIADPTELATAFNIPLRSDLTLSDVMALVLLTPHSEFAEFEVSELCRRMAEMPAIVDPWNALEAGSIDVEGIYRSL